jgi:hypothetical protein
LRAKKESGNPIATIKMNVAMAALSGLIGARVTFVNGSTSRFITTNMNMPYAIAVSTILFDMSFMEGYNRKNSIVKLYAII